MAHIGIDDKTPNRLTTTRLCAWGGLVAMAIWGVGFFALSGFVPPPSPSRTAQEVAQQFRDNTIRIQAGLALTCLGTAFLGPWVAAVSTFMKRMEGRAAPLATAQLALGALLPIEFIVPIFVWQVAAYRPNRSAEIISVLNDMAWMPFVGVVYTAVVQAIVVGIAILSDRGVKPVFPRWVGYFSIFCGMTFCPSSLLIFFKSGPLAWNGIASFWIVVTGYITWTAVLSILMIKTSRRLEREDLEADLSEKSELDVRDKLETLAAELDTLRSERQLTSNARSARPEAAQI
jgi:hypothetical protein